MYDKFAQVHNSFIGGENETNFWKVSIYIILSVETRSVSFDDKLPRFYDILPPTFSSTRFNTVGRRSNESPWNIILVPFASDLPRVSCILLTGFHNGFVQRMIYRLSSSIDQSRGSNLFYHFSKCIFPRLSLLSLSLSFIEDSPCTLKIVKNILIHRC